MSADSPNEALRPPPPHGKPTDDDLYDRFHYHSPIPDGVSRHSVLSGRFLVVASTVRDVCPPGRELSLALTHLEEAKFWASAAVARNPETR